jgi:AbiV family abortive infection protein
LKKQIILTKNGKQYVSEAIKNSKQFLKDAKILIENGSFAHGAALAVLAIEEGAKAKIATQYIDWKGALEIDSKTYKEEIKDHFNKLSQAAKDHMITAMMYRLIPEGPTGSCSLRELQQRLEVLADSKDGEEIEIESWLYACLTVLKMKWLYVDIEKGEVKTPLTWSKEDALKVLQMAEKRLSEYETQIINWVK